MGTFVVTENKLGKVMWEMGGYGQFVWSAYGVVFIGLFIFMLSSLKKAKQVKQLIKRQKEYRSQEQNDKNLNVAHTK